MQPYGGYCFIELAALLSNNHMARNRFVRIDDSLPIVQWRKQFNNTDIFFSVCIYKSANSQSEYIVPIFFDIDSQDDLSAARTDAISLCEKIINRLKLPYECLEIYFSGNKGFHILVSCEVFQPPCSNHMLGLYKRMAEQAQKSGIQHIDVGVYSNRRILRAPNSRHRKSGLYKVGLTYEELRDISVDGITQLATKPRPQNSYATPEMCKHAVAWYQLAIKCYEKTIQQRAPQQRSFNGFKEGWRMPPCIKNIQDAVLPDGIRHEAYMALSRFYGFVGMHPNEALERIHKIDSRNPIHDPENIVSEVKWGNKTPGFPGCSNSVLKRYCQKEECFYPELRDHIRDSKKTDLAGQENSL